MAVVYRAMWDTGTREPVGTTVKLFADWVAEKAPEALVVPADGAAEAVSGEDRYRVTVERSGPENDLGIDAAFKAVFVESTSDGTQWTTTVRAWSGLACAGDPRGRGNARLWVDVQNVAYDSSRIPSIRAPRLVRRLLDDDAYPVRRDLPLSTRVQQFAGEEGAERLAALITDVDRDLPIVVFAPPESDLSPSMAYEASDIELQMKTAASAVAGMAMVSCIDVAAVSALGNILGVSYSVWGGAFRIYQPGADPALNDDWRHRYVLPKHYLGRHREAATNVIVRSISPYALSRRPEQSYEMARKALRARLFDDLHEDNKQLIEFLLEENTKLERDLQAANEQAAQDRAAFDAAIDEQGAAQEEAGKLRARLQRMTKAMSDNGLSGKDAPHGAACPSEAVEHAREYLDDRLVIPLEACRDLDDLDAATTSFAWGQSSWDAFRALHAYGLALADPTRKPGTFWNWCEQSRDPLVWPATSKKLAMTESESVRNRKKHAGKRILPVHEEVSADGRIEMLAHIKIAEGGGDLAPRIYFHVDDKRAKVHVGFFGPHKHMPNTKT